jgi:hypothetical protein
MQRSSVHIIVRSEREGGKFIAKKKKASQIGSATDEYTYFPESNIKCRNVVIVGDFECSMKRIVAKHLDYRFRRGAAAMERSGRVCKSR